MATAAPTGAVPVAGPNMDQARARTVQNEFMQLFVEFLTEFRDMESDEAEPPYKYRIQASDIEFGRTGVLVVSFRDIMTFSVQLEQTLRSQFYEVEPVLRASVVQLVAIVNPDLAVEAGEGQQEYAVKFVDLPECENLRDLKVDKIGHLTSFAGTVTRTSEVRPELFKGQFKCDSCFTVMKDVEQQFKYTTPVICSNPTCGNKSKFTLVKEHSTFIDWQRVKVQENADEVPAGSLPRTMDVIMRGRIVETANPGDKMRFTGMLVVVPDVASLATPGGVSVKSSTRGDKTSAADGFTMKSSGVRELTYKLMFIASSCEPPVVKTGAVNIRSDDHLTSEEVLNSYDSSAMREVETMMNDPQVYQKLTRSLCPSVYGHNSIKQAVLLMMMGGVHKRTHEGINLRGDINVAIVGDPGCAKSQILKYVANFLPRAVYTSGKASTAAGLTASVVREPENNEFAIEAGALMLADNGICCIDEFDKMDVKDQVAIHEAMEQQTISITKAGIQATLNARASILAAANPLGGRYDKSKPLKYNVALPPAILSRFDLLHVMVDDTDDAADMRIARHIISVHCQKQQAFDNVPYKTEAIQRYIRYARSIKPQLSQEAADKLVRLYKELRSDDAAPGTQSAYRITVRQLEALVRLSEAMARVYCQDVIRPNHVEEAARLLKSSILKIEQSDIELDDLAYPQPQPEDLADVLAEAEAQAREDAEMADAQGATAAPAVDGQAGEAGAGDATTQGAQQPGAPPAVEEPVQPASKETTKITAHKFNYMRNMLAKKLTEVQEQARGVQESETGTEQEQDEAGGIRQQELMRWYIDTQIRRKTVVGYEQADQEMSLLFKVINKLILQGNTVAVLSKPEREVEEDDAAYNLRQQLDRVLSLHANYAPDA